MPRDQRQVVGTRGQKEFQIWRAVASAAKVSACIAKIISKGSRVSGIRAYVVLDRGGRGFRGTGNFNSRPREVNRPVIPR